jgi:hypothetical protein
MRFQAAIEPLVSMRNNNRHPHGFCLGQVRTSAARITIRSAVRRL